MSLKSDTKGVYDFDLSASSYNYLQDIMLNPFTVGCRRASAIPRTARSRATTAPTGRTPMPRASGARSAMTVRRRSASASMATAIAWKIRSIVSSIWNATSSTGTGQLYSDSVGETRTGALWVQDAWKIAPNLKLTLGGRLETWRALDGFNVNTTAQCGTGVRSPIRRCAP